MNMTIVRTLVLPAALALVAVIPAFALAHNDSEKTVSARADTMVQIQGNGNVLVRGAEVTSISDSTVYAETSHGGVELSWTVKTDGDTEFLFQNGNNADLNDIEEGDTVSFSGALDGSLVVDASVVKEWSLPSDAHTAVTGTITDIDNDSFVLSNTRFGDITVVIDSETTFTKRGDKDLNLGDLSVGEKVAVSGTYSSDDDTLEAEQVTIAKVEMKNFGENMKGWFKQHFNFGFWKN